VAPAIIVPDGSRKTIQHLEGGIVQRVLVRDGERVAAGQPLVELDPTRTLAEHAALLADWRALTAAETRLVAEQAGASEVRFPEALLAAKADPDVARLLQGEVERFTSRARSLADQEAILRERIRQSEAQITGHKAEIRSAESQLALVKEEIATVKGLLQKGLERQPRLLALEWSRAQIEGLRGTPSRRWPAPGRPSARHSSRSRRSAASGPRRWRTSSPPPAATSRKCSRSWPPPPTSWPGSPSRPRSPARWSTSSSRPRAAWSVRATRSSTSSPRTTPWSWRPAWPLWTSTRSTRASPPAQIHLLAYKSRNLPRIQGLVREVSADRLADPKTGEPYYKARIAVPASALPKGITLAPGMPAEALIVTAQRTFLSYLTQPLKDAFRRGLRES
jgi:HlyD family secretion protein/epimerase transport system membrane fusion protein